MRVLVTGASGMLGKDVVDVFSRSEENEVFGIYRNRETKLPYKNFSTINLDLTELDNLQRHLKDIKPDIIVHCAAVVNVDECENNREYVKLFHCDTTRVLAESAPGAQMVYISSDSVFDGEKGDYTEEDQPNPLNYYAQTKYEGEIEALQHNTNTIVLRTNIYGFHLRKMPSLAEFGLENLQNNKAFNGFDDVYFNPLYTKQLAEIVKSLTANRYKGIINAGCETFVSKYAFLVELAKVFGYDENLVQAKSVNTVNFKALRPKNTTLNISLLEKHLNIHPQLSIGLELMHKDYLLHQSQSNQNKL